MTSISRGKNFVRYASGALLLEIIFTATLRSLFVSYADRTQAYAPLPSNAPTINPCDVITLKCLFFGIQEENRFSELCPTFALPISTILSDTKDHNHVIQRKINGLSGRHHFIAVLQKSPRKSICDKGTKRHQSCL